MQTSFPDVGHGKRKDEQNKGHDGEAGDIQTVVAGYGTVAIQVENMQPFFVHFQT